MVDEILVSEVWVYNNNVVLVRRVVSVDGSDLQFIVIPFLVVNFNVISDVLTIHFELDNFAFNFSVHLLDNACSHFFTIQFSHLVVAIALLRFTDILTRCEKFVAIC